MKKGYKLEQVVRYTNGSNTIYKGTIKKIVPQNNGTLSFVIIDETDNASLELWNAGGAVGSFINETQILN